MRQIKFRAWDGEKIIDKFNVARPDFANCLSIMTDEEFAKSHYSLKEWKIMQFTGLLDKNGKEIYEGDILKYVNYYSGRSVLRTVESEMDVDNMSDMYIYGWVFGSRSDIPNQSEIIGNIYENQELLNG